MGTVLTLGTFDILHPGHVALFRECRKLGSRLVVAVNADEFVERFKDRTPVMDYAERSALVAALRDVDEVVANDGYDQPGLIRWVDPDVIAVGMDWAEKDYHAQLGITPDWLVAQDIALRYVEHEHSRSVSSSLVRHRLGVW